MRRVALVFLALAAAGCGGGTAERAAQPEATATAPPSPAAKAGFLPAWLSQTYSDGKILVRYPKGWHVSRSRRFGTVLSPGGGAPAFVGIQYLPRREYESHEDFGDLAARIVRPPNGRGTSLLYTQAARIGDRGGIEASLVFALTKGSPLGPRMRVFGIELDSGQVAIVIFAADQLSDYATPFAWIKRGITWT